MVSGIFMSHDASAGKIENGDATSRPVAIATAIEVALLFAAILAYIWRWQHVHPRLWIALFALILLSHVLHRDTLRGLGLRGAEMRAGAQWLFPLAVLLYLPLLMYGFFTHRLAILRPNWQSLLMLLGYGCWCAFQQYLTQSYFHNRLMLIVHNRHVRCALVGIMFSATHIPNLILMIATLVAGFVFAVGFSKYRNIWPLALTQAVGGLLLAAVTPDALIHHMRVGPGYFFYGIR